MKLQHMACTHKGRRPNNEDSHCEFPDLGLFLVADGMGGYEGGEVASALTIETVGDFYYHNAADREITWPVAGKRNRSLEENIMGVALRLAHSRIRARRQGRLAQMGSTAAALVLRSGLAIVGHVGDSRVYRLRDGVLQQLTMDHSLMAEMQAAGTEDLPDPSRWMYRNVVTRALGTDCARPDLCCEPVREGDRYLLCTDGLLEKLKDAEIRPMLAAHPPRRCCPMLVQEAYARGGRDNITAVVVGVGTV